MIYLANNSQQRYGGGFSFIENFKKALRPLISDYESSDVYFISSPTMVQREEVQRAIRDNKRIVLRVDNAVRNSRNRNTGMTRMKDFADWADIVIYQSEWARQYLQPFLEAKNTVVIHNSVDEEVFNAKLRKPKGSVYLYSRYNRDETKNWEVARYMFSQIVLTDPKATLNIVGNFSPELIDGNFDFYNNERFQYWGVQPVDVIADIYRASDIFLMTYFNDACSNTLIEALMCGCRVPQNYYTSTGGSPEILDKFNQEREYFHLARMADDYRKALNV